MRTILSQSNQYNASILLSPSAATMIARSSSASDTQVANLWGTEVGAGSASIVPNTLTGKLELETDDFDALTRVELASVAVGAITLRRHGTKAAGTLTFNSNPTDGQQLVIGLTGNTRTYTFKDGEKSTILCLSNAADALDGKYFDIYESGTSTVRVWFNSTTAGAAAPATPSGGRLLEVSVANTDNTAILVATKLAAAMDADAGFRASSGGTDTVTAFVAGYIYNTTDIAAGTSGFTCTKVTDGPNSANNVLIGKTMYLTARNLNYALNADGTPGRHYGDSTAVNALITAWADTGHTDDTLNGTSENVIYIQDQLGCSRLLSWTCTEPASMSKSLPVGGIDGDLICEIAPGQYGAGAVVSLDSTSGVNVSIGSLPVFDPIQTFGRHSRLYVQNDGPGDIELKIYSGPDVDHLVLQETLNVTMDVGVVDQSAIIGPSEFVQARITSVATDDCAVFAAIVF